MHQCKNAKETLELVDRDSAFDLILLDIEMPVMNGQEFFTELQKHELPIPIVFITGTAGTLEEDQTFFDRPVLCKPFTLDDLLEAVGKHLKSLSA